MSGEGEGAAGKNGVADTGAGGEKDDELTPEHSHTGAAAGAGAGAADTETAKLDAEEGKELE